MAARTGKSAAVPDRPEIDMVTENCLLAFNRLSAGRNLGMGLCRLVISEIIIYFNNVVTLIADLELFIDVMIEMDSVFIGHHEDKK